MTLPSSGPAADLGDDALDAGEALLRLLETRRSVAMTLLTEPGPNAAQLNRLLAIAARVPDHGALAPWRFVVLEGAARAEASAGLGAIYAAENPAMDPEKRVKFAGIMSRVFTHAPVVVIVVSRTDPDAKVPVWEQELSAGAVCMNLLTGAQALGFGANWLTGWAAYNASAQRLLGLAEGERIAGVVHLGTPKERPTERARPDLAAIATWWRAPPA
jgi:nitroreductase